MAAGGVTQTTGGWEGRSNTENLRSNTDTGGVGKKQHGQRGLVEEEATRGGNIRSNTENGDGRVRSNMNNRGRWNGQKQHPRMTGGEERKK